ncbi:MAG: cytochrome c peroxidase [Pseudohongiellaceae bacterium]
MKNHLGLLMAVSLISPLAYSADAVEPDYLAFLQAKGEAPWINAATDHPSANTAYRPMPPLASFPADSVKRDLGFDLFHDASLSRDGTVGCNTCHMGMRGATDGRTKAVGIGGAIGLRNTPTIFNSAFNFRQFWDGRSFDLDAQSLAPISDPVEMGHDLDLVLELLKASPRYVSRFEEAYPDGVTAANLGNAIAQHSKDMTRTDSPFNAYLTDSANALSDQAQRGWNRFNELGCVSCHNGINLGGNSYQRLGNTPDFVATVLRSALSDEGLARRTQRDIDRQVFKVPTLHNVALTAPYFHDGSIATLQEAVAQMGQLQAGRQLSEPDVDDIVAFLESLNSAFFDRGMPGMTAEQLPEAMRRQMPDAMNHEQGEHMMQDHSQEDQHIMHMRQMQNQNGAAEKSPADASTEHTNRGGH